jgi:ketosteroid isomerase-like protein
MAEQDFPAFFEPRKRAAHEYANGNPKPLLELVPDKGMATFQSPRGDTVIGVQAVADRYRSDAKNFRPGVETSLEVLQQGAGGELAFWTGFQHASVNISGRESPARMKIRVTEIFRREDGNWRMLHRHADLAGPD